MDNRMTHQEFSSATLPSNTATTFSVASSSSISRRPVPYQHRPQEDTVMSEPGTAEFVISNLGPLGLGCSHYGEKHQSEPRYPSRLGFFRSAGSDTEEILVFFLETKRFCLSCLDTLIPNASFNYWSLANAISDKKKGWLNDTPKSRVNFFLLAQLSVTRREAVPPAPSTIPLPDFAEAAEGWAWLMKERKPFYLDQLHLDKGWSIVAERNADSDSIIAKVYGTLNAPSLGNDAKLGEQNLPSEKGGNTVIMKTGQIKPAKVKTRGSGGLIESTTANSRDGNSSTKPKKSLVSTSNEAADQAPTMTEPSASSQLASREKPSSGDLESSLKKKKKKAVPPAGSSTAPLTTDTPQNQTSSEKTKVKSSEKSGEKKKTKKKVEKLSSEGVAGDSPSSSKMNVDKESEVKITSASSDRLEQVKQQDTRKKVHKSSTHSSHHNTQSSSNIVIAAQAVSASMEAETIASAGTIPKLPTEPLMLLPEKLSEGYNALEKHQEVVKRKGVTRNWGRGDPFPFDGSIRRDVSSHSSVTSSDLARTARTVAPLASEASLSLDQFLPKELTSVHGTSTKGKVSSSVRTKKSESTTAVKSEKLAVSHKEAVHKHAPVPQTSSLPSSVQTQKPREKKTRAVLDPSKEAKKAEKKSIQKPADGEKPPKTTKFKETATTKEKLKTDHRTRTEVLKRREPDPTSVPTRPTASNAGPGKPTRSLAKHDASKSASSASAVSKATSAASGNSAQIIKGRHIPAQPKLNPGTSHTSSSRSGLPAMGTGRPSVPTRSQDRPGPSAWSASPHILPGKGMESHASRSHYAPHVFNPTTYVSNSSTNIPNSSTNISDSTTNAPYWTANISSSTHATPDTSPGPGETVTSPTEGSGGTQISIPVTINVGGDDAPSEPDIVPSEIDSDDDPMPDAGNSAGDPNSDEDHTSDAFTSDNDPTGGDISDALTSDDGQTGDHASDDETSDDDQVVDHTSDATTSDGENVGDQASQGDGSSESDEPVETTVDTSSENEESDHNSQISDDSENENDVNSEHNDSSSESSDDASGMGANDQNESQDSESENDVDPTGEDGSDDNDSEILHSSQSSSESDGDDKDSDGDISDVDNNLSEGENDDQDSENSDGQNMTSGNDTSGSEDDRQDGEGSDEESSVGGTRSAESSDDDADREQYARYSSDSD